MISPELIETLGSITTSTAVVIGARIAWLGLRTWQRQLRWQQGRAVAVNLLQSAWDIRRHLRAMPTSGNRSFDERHPDKAASDFRIFAGRVQEYLDELALKQARFEELVAEVIIIWGDDFGDLVERFRDIEQELKFFLSHQCIAMNPDATAHERRSAGETTANLHDEIWGTGTGGKKGVVGQAQDILNALENILRAKDFR